MPRRSRERSERSAKAGEFWIAAGIFAAFTVILTWPQAISLQSIRWHEDSFFNMWRLAWFAHAMATNPTQLFQANIFWPERDTFAYSDAVLVEGALAAPFLWMGVPTPVVHSLLLFVSFVFAACSAYVLARHLTGRFGASILAGMIFAFAPFRFDHYMHMEMLWSGWMPLAVLSLLRLFEEGRARWGVMTAVLALLQTLSAIYYGVFLIMVLGVMTVVLWFRQSNHTRRRAIVGLTLGAVLSGAILLPYLQPYRRAREIVGERPYDVARLHSAGPKHFLAASPDNWLYGGYADAISRPEKRLFAGFIGLTLAAIGLWPPIDRRRVACLAGLLIAVNLTIGVNGLGYTVLREHIEIFRGLRAPARAAQLVLLFIGVFAAYGMARLQSRLASRRPALMAYAPALCAAGLALEYATMPLALVPVPPRSPSSAWLAGQPAGIVAEIPMPSLVDRQYEPQVIYQSTFHWKTLVNGHSGSMPWSNGLLALAVATLPSERGLDALKQAGVRYIIVHEAWYGPAAYRAVIDFFDARADLARRAVFSDGKAKVAAYEVMPR